MIDHTAALWRYAEARSRIDRSAGPRHRIAPLLEAIFGNSSR